MATQKLLEELAEKEAQATEKELAATARVNEIEKHVQDRIEELASAQRARLQAECAHNAENDRRIRLAEMQARERVAEAEQARRVAARAAEDAERNAEAAQSSLQAAQRSLEALQRVAQRRIAIAEQGAALATRGAQAHMSLANAEAAERLKQFDAHVVALKADAEKKHANLHRAALDQVSLAEDRAASRARFRELCGLTRVRDHMLSSPEHYGSADNSQALMMSTVAEWSKQPGRHWPWKYESSGPTVIESHPHLEGKAGSDVFSSSMRYHPVCLGVPWLGADDPKAQTGPSRQILSEEHIKTPLRPQRLPFGESVSKFQGFGSFGTDSSKRQAPQSAC
jgi:hypothetical protein